MYRQRTLLAMASLIACAGLVGCPSEESPAAAYARDAEAIKRGRTLFTGTCAAYCHGLRPGHRDAPFLFDCDWKHGGRDEDLFRVILEGVPETRMQGFEGKLPDGDEDVWKLIAFLRSASTCR